MIDITATPGDDLIDVARRIAVTGARAGSLLTLRTQTVRGAGTVWTSRAVFRADDHGVIDLARDAPVEGDYGGVSAMGLLWAHAPVGADTREVFPPEFSDP